MTEEIDKSTQNLFSLIFVNREKTFVRADWGIVGVSVFKLKRKHGENGIFFWIVHQWKGAASVFKKYGMFQGNVQNCFFYWNVYSYSDLQSSLSTFWWRYHNVAVTEKRIYINDNNNNNNININNSNIK